MHGGERVCHESEFLGLIDANSLTEPPSVPFSAV